MQKCLREILPHRAHHPKYKANLHLGKKHGTRGKVPGPWKGTARWTLPFLNIVHIPVMQMLDLNLQGIGMGATGNTYRKKSGVTMILVTQTKVVPLTTCTGVVLGTSHIVQVKTVRGTNLPQTIGSRKQLCRSGVSTLNPTSLHWWETV